MIIHKPRVKEFDKKKIEGYDKLDNVLEKSKQTIQGKLVIRETSGAFSHCHCI